MTVLASYAASLAPALAWTLAHFLWQGALVALLLQLLLKTCATARARHDLALGALVVMALAPIATFAWLQGDMRIVMVPAGFPGLETGEGQGWETVAVAAWLSGVAVLAARTAGGLLLIERLRRDATPLPAAWAERCAALHRRMSGSLGVAFAQSGEIAAPLVAGWLKPMVLIPAAALVRLPPAQLEALILHELAHVRRLDAVANLIQTVVETALFYHPAVWWVSRQVRIEREHCCDDLAVAAVKDPALYVGALQAIEALRAAPYGVLAANGGGDLKSRAARILGLAAAPARPALSRTAAILILTAAGLAMTHSAAVQAKPGEAPPRQARAAATPMASPAPNETATAPPPGPASFVERGTRILLAEAVLPSVAVQGAPPPFLPPPASAPARPFVLALTGASSSPSVSPLVVTSQGKGPPADISIEMAGDADDPGAEPALWPAEAYQQNYDGWVTLRCRFDPHGLAERCDIAAERPLGKGFGKAALELRPTFKIAPSPDADRASEIFKTVAVRFRAPRIGAEVEEHPRPPFQDYGNLADGARAPQDTRVLSSRRITMLDFPVWTRAPSFDELASAYPAKGGGVEGYAVARCHVTRSGAMDGCDLITETPEHHDFGKAAVALAVAKFKVAPQIAAAGHSRQLWVDIPIRLTPPDQTDRTVMAPAWLTGVDEWTSPKVFPPEAAASGLTTGRGIARCTVGAQGVLTGCAPESAEPAGLGFAEAAAKVVTGMKMNLWTKDAAPVEGGVVHVPVRLNLKGG